MNDDGVLGGSMFGATFFHASTKVVSAAAGGATSVEKVRARIVADTGRVNSREACLNMVCSVVLRGLEVGWGLKGGK